MLKKILRGAGSDALKYFPVRLVPALTSLITVPLFTRLIDPADYGNFYLITSATSLTATFATAWITGSVVRFYWPHKKDGKLNEYVATTVWSAVGSLAAAVVLVGIAILVFAERLPDGLAVLAPIALASLAFNYTINVLLQVLRASNRSTQYAVLAVASSLIATTLSVYFVWGPRLGSFGILAGVALGNLLLLPFGLRAVSKEGSISPRNYDRDILREFTSYGFPLVPAAISTWLLVLADRYVIGIYRGAAEVGLYSVAYGLGDKIMNLIILPLTIAIAPVMVQTFEEQGQLMAQKVQTQFTRYFAMATVPLLFGMAAAGQEFMQVFTGEQYRSAFPILSIVAASILMNGLTQIAGNGVALHKKSTIMMSNALTAGGFNVVTNLLLVPRYGYMAAAYTTFASYLLLLTLTWYRSRPYMAWHLPWADLLRIAGASSLMYLVLAFGFARVPVSALTFLAQIAAGIMLYVVGLMLFRAVRPDEREFVGDMWRAALRKIGIGR